MEIKLLNEKFELIEILDIFTSLIWNRKYYECGQFELHVPKPQFQHIEKAKYIYINEFEETGIIEQLGYDKESAYAKGRFMEAMLNNFVISSNKNLSGTAEQINNQLIKSYMPSLNIEDRNISASRIEVQSYGDNLMDKCYDVAKSQEISFRLKYDYENDRKVFYHWIGKNRTERQDENTWTVFSTDFENITEPSYKYDDSEYRNYVYIVSKDEEKGDKIVVLDQSGGGERREIWIEGESQSEDVSDSQFVEQLRQKGMEELAKYAIVEAVDMKADTNSNLIYRQDYDLGDLCTYIDDECGIEMEQRITEITETVENNKREVQITFGEESKTIVQKLKRSVK